MSTESIPTLRSSLADGRQAALVEGRRKLIVRIFDEAPTGFHVATIQASRLADGAESTLLIEGCEIGVRVIGRTMEGRRLLIQLERLKP